MGEVDEGAVAGAQGTSTSTRSRALLNAVVEYWIFVAFIALVILFAVTSPAFLTESNILNVGRQTALVTIVAVGMTFVIICAEIDLSIASTLALAGMLGALAMNHFGNEWPVALVVALGTGAIIGSINGVLTTLFGVPSFLVTLGMLMIARGLAMIVTNTVPVPITNQGLDDFFGGGNLLGLPAPIFWTVGVVVLGVIGLHFLSFGRSVYATGGNALAARYSGISTRRVKIIAFVLSGTLAGLAAIILNARTQAARPDFANGMEMDVLAAVILGGTSLFGGRGTIIGTVVGSLMIGVLNNGLTLINVSSHAQLVVKGVIIIVAVAISRFAIRGPR
jgi:ribose/xylose/arabinose/galactoside ABC-type transport system permease subunit